jgi:hypothetical protein
LSRHELGTPYRIASPCWATTLIYFWDTSFFVTLWALLDPSA